MKINYILQELKSYVEPDKKKIFSAAVEDRLNKGVVQYYNNLSKAYDKLYLYSDNYELKLIKKLNKGMKKDE